MQIYNLTNIPDWSKVNKTSPPWINPILLFDHFKSVKIKLVVSHNIDLLTNKDFFFASGHEEPIQRRLGHDAALLQPRNFNFFEKDFSKRKNFSVDSEVKERGGSGDETIWNCHRRFGRSNELKRMTLQLRLEFWETPSAQSTLSLADFVEKQRN